MQKKCKILIIRFSSIGDIILTTPVIRCIKSQKDVELHYLTKLQYKDIVNSNIYIDKVYTYQYNYLDVIKELKKEEYDYVIDLHNNIRSKWFRLSLRSNNYVIEKENIKKLLLINFGINFVKNHTVDRYFNAIKELGFINDKKGLDYFIKQEHEIDFNVKQQYISWCIGGSYEQKKLSYDQIINVCNRIETPIVFLGGKNEKDLALRVVKNSINKKLHNFCGEISLSESANLIKNSSFLLTNDTSLMHIGAAFNTPTISFWGCTKPSLGFGPYLNKKSIEILSENTNPCSRHGNSCRHTEGGCVKLIDKEIIYKEIQKISLELLK